MNLAQKLVGAVLALLGIVLLVPGAWFAGHLGGSGTATFTLHPVRGTVVLAPSVLNRLDEPTVVLVVPRAGQHVWAGVGAPSDVTALVGTTPVTDVTGVVVRDWALVGHSRGSGSAVDPSRAEIWRETHDDTTPVTVELDQASAPETVVVTGAVDRIEVSWSHRAWFVEALVVAVLGLLLVLGGLAVAFLLPRRRRQPAPEAPVEVSA